MPLAHHELQKLLDASRRVPLTKSQYLASDFVSALLDTVVDYQMRNTAVLKAIDHFQKHRWQEVRTLDDLRQLLARYPDDKQGNTELARYLWGYSLWTRAQQLRALVSYFDALGISTIEGLRGWAERAAFSDFRGRIRGLGPVVFQWLIMRLGVHTVKPDVHLMRFVARAVGRPVSETETVDGLEWVAGRLGIPANLLDWSIWEFERERQGVR